jgi:hypothetical protein
VVRPELIRVIVLVATDGTGGAAELPGAVSEPGSEAVYAPLDIGTDKLGDGDEGERLRPALDDGRTTGDEATMITVVESVVKTVVAPPGIVLVRVVTKVEVTGAGALC